MKKLLSILASIGLTASAGATVVACNSDSGDDSKPETKEIELKAENDKLKVGQSTDVTITLNDVDVEGYTAEIKHDDKVSVSTITDAKFTVKAEKDGEAKISIEYTKDDTDPIKSKAITITIEKEDEGNVRKLEEVLINNALGELPDNEDETILDKVISLNGDLSKNDIEVDGGKSETKATIKSKDETKYTGTVEVTFTISVGRESIKGLDQTFTVDIDIKEPELVTRVNEKIKDATGKTVIKDTDYTISGFSETMPSGSTITIVAEENSKLIFGSFGIGVHDLANISDIKFELPKNVDEQDIIDLATGYIFYQAERVAPSWENFTIDYNENKTIATVTANEDSKQIQGRFDITLGEEETGTIDLTKLGDEGVVDLGVLPIAGEDDEFKELILRIAYAYTEKLNFPTQLKTENITDSDVEFSTEGSDRYTETGKAIYKTAPLPEGVQEAFDEWKESLTSEHLSYLLNKPWSKLDFQDWFIAEIKVPQLFNTTINWEEIDFNIPEVENETLETIIPIDVSIEGGRHVGFIRPTVEITKIDTTDPALKAAKELANKIETHEYEPIILTADEDADQIQIMQDIRNQINELKSFEDLVKMTIQPFTVEIPKAGDSIPHSISVSIYHLDADEDEEALEVATANITITRLPKDENDTILSDAIKIEGLLSGEGIDEDNVIERILEENSIESNIKANDLITTEFYETGNFADGKVVLTAKEDTGFIGSVTIALYNPTFLGHVKELRTAPTKTDRKRTAWQNYVTFRWNVIEEELAAERIIATLETLVEGDQAGNARKFRTWVTDQFIKGLQESSRILGITKDYDLYRYTSTGSQVFDYDKGTVTYSGATWGMTFDSGWENSDDLIWSMDEMNKSFTIPYIEIN